VLAILSLLQKTLLMRFLGFLWKKERSVPWVPLPGQQYLVGMDREDREAEAGPGNPTTASSYSPSSETSECFSSSPESY
jgi:hypothetical protein